MAGAEGNWLEQRIGVGDPSVQHVVISRLRALNVTQLRDLDKTLVIQDNDKPLAVLLKYEHFLAMQEKINAED